MGIPRGGDEMIQELRRLSVILTATLVAWSAPAFADEPMALTPSGSTEAFFDLSLVDTSDLLANSCVDYGWTTISSTPTVVMCELPISVGKAILSALAGPKYATPPRHYIRFNLAGYRGLSRVQATGWEEIQTAFGQTQTTPMASDNYHNGVTSFLIGLGGHFPPGTTFPNHAMMGVEYEYVERPANGMRLKSVIADGPFAEAGLQEGDIVLRIAGERIKGENDLSDGLHKAIKRETFQVEYLRNGERAKIDVPRVFRPDAGPLPEATVAAAEPAAGTTTIIQNEMSIASELEALAGLLERGILTQEEFDEQKAKLLARE